MPPCASPWRLHAGPVARSGMREDAREGAHPIHETGWPRRICSYPHVKMRRVFFRTRCDGTGDVVFDLQSFRGRHGDEVWSERGFKNRRAPEMMWRLLNDQARLAKTPRGPGVNSGPARYRPGVTVAGPPLRGLLPPLRRRHVRGIDNPAVNDQLDEPALGTCLEDGRGIVRDRSAALF